MDRGESRIAAHVAESEKAENQINGNGPAKGHGDLRLNRLPRAGQAKSVNLDADVRPQRAAAIASPPRPPPPYPSSIAAVSAESPAAFGRGCQKISASEMVTNCTATISPTHAGHPPCVQKNPGIADPPLPPR